MAKETSEEKYRNPLDGTVRSRRQWEAIFEFSGIEWADVVLEPVPDDPEAAETTEKAPKEEPARLSEVTGRDLGIVCYPSSREAIACAWNGYTGPPALFVTGIIYINDTLPPLHESFRENAEGIRGLMESYTVIANEFYIDEAADPYNPGAGMVYVFGDGQTIEAAIICPDTWGV